MSALMLDLRGHGRSSSSSSCESSFSSPHSISSCANDVMDTLASLKLTGGERSPMAVVGHSLGGRCALQYLHAFTSSAVHPNDVHPPRHVWLLDTVPGNAHESVAQVVRAISSVPMPVESKKELVSILVRDKGLDQAIASWMTTNLRRSKANDNAGFEYTFDLDIAQAILNDFPNQDFIRLLSECTSNTSHTKIHLVMGGKNEAWTENVVKDLQRVKSGALDTEALQLIPLENAGHWFHVDDLDGLMASINHALK